MDLKPADQEFLLKVACMTIRRRLEGAASPPLVVPSSPEVLKSAGCFVSLHARQGHALRGCVGRIDASSPLLMVLGNVAWQVLGDPRFTNNPITLATLSSLTVEISVLGMLTPAPDMLAFDKDSCGIYLKAVDRAGVFLPQVARETGWSREQLLDRLCQEKLGVPPGTWKTANAKLFTFPSLTIGPVNFLFDELPAPPLQTAR
jgi:AmmeMemoRadiSam system protein A